MQARAARQEKIAQKKAKKSGNKYSPGFWDHEKRNDSNIGQQQPITITGDADGESSHDNHNTTTISGNKPESEMTAAELKRQRKIERRAARRAEKESEGGNAQ